MRLGRAAGFSVLDLGGFERAQAEGILAGRKPPGAFSTSPSYFKWSFGGELALLARPQFILPGRLAGRLLPGLAGWLMRDARLQAAAQRMRGGR